MDRKLPNIALQTIIEAVKSGQLIQKQARLCDLAAIDALPNQILPWLNANNQKAIANAYQAVECIKFEDMYYRPDIGHRVLNK